MRRLAKELHPLLGALALAAVVAWPAARPAHATQIVAYPVEELARLSDAVVAGEVLHVEPFVHQGRISRRVTIAVATPYKGAEGAETVEVVAVGGRLGEYATWVSGAERYEVGEQVLVFLQELQPGTFVASGLSFGKFELLEEQGVTFAVRDIHALGLLEHSVVNGLVVPAASSYRTDFTLVELESLILEGIEETAP